MIELALNKLANKIYEIENKKIINYYGDYEHYKKKKIEFNKKKVKNTKNNNEKNKKIVNNKVRKIKKFVSLYKVFGTS